MSRTDDLRRLYDILEELRARVGDRRLRDCDGRMGWPARGIYFFFEQGERRSASGSGPRVVRVGTHAISGVSKTTLWNRLSAHRGPRAGGGNHRGSIFRLLVGEALANRDGPRLASWGIASAAGEAARRTGVPVEILRDEELPLERAVTQFIANMPFVWVAVDDPAGPDSLRGFVERNTIALLSNWAKPRIDAASPGWLGLHSGRERVRESGLWNNNHVEESYDSSAVDVLARLARNTSGPSR
jgi:hypothetical protein